MPEGHTIHRLARDLRKSLVGKSLVVSSPQGRLATDRINGSRLESVDAVGKHLFMMFSEASLHIHLGLFGRFFRKRSDVPPKPAVRLRLEAAPMAWELSGATICAWTDEEEIASITARLGPDPLSERCDPNRAWTAIRASDRPIGALLLDQQVIAGIGNVYRAEILHLAKIHPMTPGSALTLSQYRRLWSLTKSLLERGVTEGRIRTVDKAEHGPRKGSLYVYGRRDCRTCGALIERLQIAQREIAFCSKCQASLAARTPKKESASKKVTQVSTTKAKTKAASAKRKTKSASAKKR
jgi:endonuclease VIII